MSENSKARFILTPDQNQSVLGLKFQLLSKDRLKFFAAANLS